MGNYVSKAILLFYVCRCNINSSMSAGGCMVAVGLTLKAACVVIESYPNTVIACYNAPGMVTLSGATEDIMRISENLKSAGTFVRLIPTDGVAYHSTFFQKKKDHITVRLVFALTPTLVAQSLALTSSSNLYALTLNRFKGHNCCCAASAHCGAIL